MLHKASVLISVGTQLKYCLWKKEDRPIIRFARKHLAHVQHIQSQLNRSTKKQNKKQKFIYHTVQLSYVILFPFMPYTIRDILLFYSSTSGVNRKSHPRDTGIFSSFFFLLPNFFFYSFFLSFCLPF